mgnify:CR=1 FL=1
MEEGRIGLSIKDGGDEGKSAGCRRDECGRERAGEVFAQPVREPGLHRLVVDRATEAMNETITGPESAQRGGEHRAGAEFAGFDFFVGEHRNPTVRGASPEWKFEPWALTE